MDNLQSEITVGVKPVAPLEERPLTTYRLMVVLTEMTDIEAWVQLALQLTPEGGEIHLRGIVIVPEDKSPSEGANQARQWRDLLSPLSRSHPVIHDEVRIYVDHQPMAHILEELQDAPVDLLLVQWAGPEELTGGLSTDHILSYTPCDVVLLSGSGWQASGPVLLSLRGGPNITLGVKLAKALSGNSYITLFHAADRQHSAPNLRVVTRYEPQIWRIVTAVTGIAEGILREAAGHKAIVLGTSFRAKDGNGHPAESLVHKLYQQTDKPIALVRARQPESLEFHTPHLLARAEENLSRRVDRWFAENSFHSHEFSDLQALLALKEKQGVTISVGLPALNEEETVGKVISTLKKALMDDVPLVDEFVLIDSNSTDNTVAIAEAAGIPVYKHSDLLPEMGAYVGKGEALWKSLYALKGDIVVWVDTDITNIHPRFVYGLLGPLLKSARIQYVKGFYQRPIKTEGGKMQAYGGGRVTELVARPMFNLFYPELSGLIQPLSGEYAGRRAALEQVPFFTGYGVETGLLLDLLERFGLEAIAQTDLEMRVHHNQPLEGLSKMSFAILQVFISRLEGRYGAQLLEKANRSMKLVIQEPERFALDIAEIGDQERPPMINVLAYREKFGR
jgi:glucosyl-3-phosphoglycerate synthase